MENKKRSFFERLTGSITMKDEDEEIKKYSNEQERGDKKSSGSWIEEEADEAELAVDVYQTTGDIIVQTMVAGVRPEDLELTIGRDVLTIRGKREENRTIDEDDYSIKELYWGKFSRDISLPAEVEPEEVEATEKHGLLTVKMQKVDKEKKNTVKVKSI
ncbi:MAG TPA: Hsp20/alpha crystallin family protein [Candidatus Paceibacterota bacterium]|jgi:HSP20 family protein|nr:Hsp20/alpha crystallin family protein [Candidatus Paceibacterota bacterium]